MPSLASIPSPSSSGIDLGPFELHAYGLCYVFAVLAAVYVARRRWKAVGGDPELIDELALWGFPAGLIGGRVYFLITTPGDAWSEWWKPFAIWEGGLGLWGGIAFGVAGGLYRARRAEVSLAMVVDACAPGILVAQAIGRVGNWFNQELYGRPTDLPWGLEIAPEHRPERYLDSATFHPTFLYEITWDLLLAVALVLVGRRFRIRPPGIFALYVAGYSFFRAGMETLRVDEAARLFGVRWNLMMALAIGVAGVVWFVWTQRRAEPTTPPSARPPVKKPATPRRSKTPAGGPPRRPTRS